MSQNLKNAKTETRADSVWFQQTIPASQKRLCCAKEKKLNSPLSPAWIFWNFICVQWGFFGKSWRWQAKCQTDQILLNNLFCYFSQFGGITSFSFPLAEIREKIGNGNLPGTHLIVRAMVRVSSIQAIWKNIYSVFLTKENGWGRFQFSWSFQDFYSLEELPGQAESFILDSGIRVKFAGGKYRTFKPGANIPCYVSMP